MDWTDALTKDKVPPLVGVVFHRSTGGKGAAYSMNKTFGVCLGVLVLGLAGFGAPASRAASGLTEAEAGGGSEAVTTNVTTSSSTPATSSPADLQQRIDSLKAELADLDAQLAAAKSQEPASSDASATQDQSSPAPATPAAQAPAAAAPMPLSSPSMTAPLSTAIPHEISAGPFGKLEVTGVLSGMGAGEDNQIALTGPNMHWDVSNAQVFVQKTTGWWQFYLQGGAYNILTLGVPFTSTSATMGNLFGPLSTGYLKLVKGNFNVEVGEIPTLIGAEYTFDFENMNIERGLLWNQENAISRGIQLSDTYKKLSVSLAYTDGFFSNRYTWLTGSLAYAFNSSNTLTFVGGGNAGAYNKGTAATPFYQNNSEIYNLIYTYTHGNWVITPYYQYTNVPTQTFFGTPGAHTNGGALLANYNFKHGFSLAVRPEYIKSSGSPATGEANLLGYGSGTGAFAFTATPTWSKDGFFIRGDISVVHVTNFDTTADFAFGSDGLKTDQVRGVIEAGVMF